jgi:diacylglycerol kinase (ATP)
MTSNASLTSFTSALIVVNPTAGANDRPSSEQLNARCQALPGTISTLRTSRPEEAVAAVADAVAGTAREETLLVVAAGGDGTAREVAEGLARGLGRWPGTRAGRARAVLFIVPAGSGNSAYRALWGERAWEETLDATLRLGGCRVRDIDLIGLPGSDRASLLGVNFGLIAEVAKVIERDKAGWRSARLTDTASAENDDRDGGSDDEQARYWDAFAEVLGDLRPFSVQVEVDDELVYRGPATLVAVGGVSSFGRGSFRLLPRATLDDGRLDVCVVGGVSDRRLAELSTLVPSGEHIGEPEVVYVQGRRAVVKRTDGERLLLEHDGDPRTAGQLVVLESAVGAVPVVAPSAHP